MTEFIPSPQEKREGLIRNHSFNLIENLHHWLSQLEEELGLPLDEAEACTVFLDKIKQDETRNAVIHTNLITQVATLTPDPIPSVKNSQRPGAPARFWGVSFSISAHSLAPRP